MTQCITQLTLGFFKSKPVVIDFDAPEISSDVGFVLVRQVDDRLGVSASFAEAMSDRRDPSRVVHDLQEQIRQRVFPGFDSRRHISALTKMSNTLF